MPSITVRNVPDEVHRALRARASRHGRSAEAEIRDILERAVKPEQRVRLGDALAALGRRIGLTDKDFAVIEKTRDKTPAEPTYAKLAVTARTGGEGFPTPDGYVAAIAASRGFVVASRDTAPYEAGGLTVVNPWDGAQGPA